MSANQVACALVVMIAVALVFFTGAIAGAEMPAVELVAVAFIDRELALDVFAITL